nr:MAG TPA_asm: hypothetical protein [Caudoviricetes sp.]
MPRIEASAAFSISVLTISPYNKVNLVAGHYRNLHFCFVSDGVHRCAVGSDFRGAKPPPPLASNRRRSPCFGAHRIRPQLECSTALGLNHTIIVLASPLIDIPLNLLSSTSTERQPGSPSGRGLAMFPAVSFLCLALFGE